MKRRDPWRGANGRPKAVADLALSGEDAKQDYRRVLTWFAGRWRNHQSKRAEKPHSKSRGGNARDGPATRPETPLAVENSVGKPAALARGRAQCRPGEESMANSHRPLSCPSDRKVRWARLFFGGALGAPASCRPVRNSLPVVAMGSTGSSRQDAGAPRQSYARISRTTSP